MKNKEERKKWGSSWWQILSNVIYTIIFYDSNIIILHIYETTEQMQ